MLRSHTQIEHRIAMLTNNKTTWSNDHVAKQRTKVHDEVVSFHNTQTEHRIAMLTNNPKPT